MWCWGGDLGWDDGKRARRYCNGFLLLMRNLYSFLLKSSFLLDHMRRG